ncbi:hypothetical protein C2845_PM06G31880 [Panicum miliaceum]|uniref:Uncharacterized protein n=1 Tax=Panicum miliaceum TaxID=4540 RepID=A0A3L6R9M4_PANMI|nr:hypothetical protein C2845_PM06G31880 [Panicum miliaceum]
MASSYDPSLYLSDLGPASPSAYLDLPSTPQHEKPQQPQYPQPNGGAAASPEDMVLPFISRMLMEEDIDDKFFYEYPDHPALLQAQQPFLDILSDDGSSSPYPARSGASVTHPSTSTSSSDAASAADATLTPAAVDSYAQFNAFDLDPAAFFSGGANSDLMSSAFLKGMEEANKFLPSQDKLVIDLDPPDDARSFVRPAENKLAASGFKFNGAAPAAAVAVKVGEAVVAAPGGGVGGRGRKNRFDDDEDDLEMDRRSSKQSALQGDGDDRDVLDKQYMITSHEMCVAVEQMEKLRIPMQDEGGGNGKAKAKGGGGRRGGREVVDLRTLLLHCAQAVATDDRRSATELLKQIKRHASPQGDATQRLAHCFAEGLQARLAGTGSRMVYQSLMAKRTSVVDILQAYQLYMAAICFKKAAFLFSNQTIYNASLGKKKIHIVDYGIHYGFQWPCFLRRIACREGGPPEVRITGIDLPQPGFRPTQRAEETGRRLSKYCQEFGVPFRYQVMAASRMETIRAEDLNLDPEEVLIVNCIYQFQNLMDESVLIESPRDVALNNIRKMRPHAFVHGVVNGSFSVPFFLTRFREALFYYSALFDVLDTTTPRDSSQRMLIEQNIFGRAALNAIACEGTDRVERPETYRQWQVRNQRAGLKQLPLNPNIVQVVRDKVKGCYHKDFVVDIDHHWLLQGWKGRILYAISTWVANDDDAGSYF